MAEVVALALLTSLLALCALGAFLLYRAERGQRRQAMEAARDALHAESRVAQEAREAKRRARAAQREREKTVVPLSSSSSSSAATTATDGKEEGHQEQQQQQQQQQQEQEASICMRAGGLRTVQQLWDWRPGRWRMSPQSTGEEEEGIGGEFTLLSELHQEWRQQEHGDDHKDGVGDGNEVGGGGARAWDTTRSRLMVVHDMKGGYIEDAHICGSRFANPYMSLQWEAMDIFVYFAHCAMVCIPPPQWIRLGHLHDTLVLGTFITEWDAGARACAAMLASEETARRSAHRLAAIAEHHAFDGWLINIENALQPEGHIEHCLVFLRTLTERMHALRPGASQVVWYDSVVAPSGALDWQNCLNEKNECFMDACDGMYVNYTWTPDAVAASAARPVAKGRRGQLYFGIDVFGRGTYGDGGYTCDAALEVIARAGVSAALFAPGWVLEHEVEPRPPLAGDWSAATDLTTAERCFQFATTEWIKVQAQFWDKCHRVWRARPLHLFRPPTGYVSDARNPVAEWQAGIVATDFSLATGHRFFLNGAELQSEPHGQKSNAAQIKAGAGARGSLPWYNLFLQSRSLEIHNLLAGRVLGAPPSTVRCSYSFDVGFQGGGSIQLTGVLHKDARVAIPFFRSCWHPADEDEDDRRFSLRRPIPHGSRGEQSAPPSPSPAVCVRFTCATCSDDVDLALRLTMAPPHARTRPGVGGVAATAPSRIRHIILRSHPRQLHEEDGPEGKDGTTSTLREDESLVTTAVHDVDSLGTSSLRRRKGHWEPIHVNDDGGGSGGHGGNEGDGGGEPAEGSAAAPQPQALPAPPASHTHWPTSTESIAHSVLFHEDTAEGRMPAGLSEVLGQRSVSPSSTRARDNASTTPAEVTETIDVSFAPSASWDWATGQHGEAAVRFVDHSKLTAALQAHHAAGKPALSAEGRAEIVEQARTKCRPWRTRVWVLPSWVNMYASAVLNIDLVCLAASAPSATDDSSAEGSASRRAPLPVRCFLGQFSMTRDVAPAAAPCPAEAWPRVRIAECRFGVAHMAANGAGATVSLSLSLDVNRREQKQEQELERQQSAPIEVSSTLAFVDIFADTEPIRHNHTEEANRPAQQGRAEKNNGDCHWRWLARAHTHTCQVGVPLDANALRQGAEVTLLLQPVSKSLTRAPWLACTAVTLRVPALK